MKSRSRSRRASASREAAVDLGWCLLEAYVLSWEPWCEQGGTGLFVLVPGNWWPGN